MLKRALSLLPVLPVAVEVVLIPPKLNGDAAAGAPNTPAIVSAGLPNSPPAALVLVAPNPPVVPKAIGSDETAAAPKPGIKML